MQSVTKHIEQFSNTKVLVIGDVMLDSYIYGVTHRISPEAPVPILNQSRTEHRPGGAANVALNCLSLGATPLLCAVVGLDDAAKLLLNALEHSGISCDHIVKSNDRKTTHKTRILAQSQHLLRIDHEQDHPLSDLELTLIQQHISTIIDQVQIVLFEDYDKGCLTAPLIRWTIHLAQSKRIPTVVDPKKRNFWAYQQCTLFKPNWKELNEGLKWELQIKEDDILKAMKALHEKLEATYYLVTLSDKGAVIYDGTKLRMVPAHKRTIADVSGAGDTVVTVAALLLASQASSDEIVVLSNLAGGIVCEYQGVVPLSLDRFKQEITWLDTSSF